jgi:hypothetical protein
MDKETAKQKLSELRDSINEVLGAKSSSISKADAEQALEQAKEGGKRLKKSLLQRIKDLPVVSQASHLGAAGTVAIGTAAVTQTQIAVDETEIFVAEVAEDAVNNMFEVPDFIDRIVDFSEVNAWGQQVIQSKVAEAQGIVQKNPNAVAAIAKTVEAKQAVQPKAEVSKDTQQAQKSESNSNQPQKQESKQNSEQKQSEQKSAEPNSSKEFNQGEQKAEGESNSSLPEVINPGPNDSDRQTITPGSDILTPFDIPRTSPSGPLR